jgi:hypothetical protein
MPIRIGTKPVPAGTGYAGGDLDAKVEARQAIPIDRDADSELLHRVYRLLLKFRGLKPEIRRVVRKALGELPQDDNRRVELARTMVLRQMVEEAVARMQANGEHPPGGRRTAALAEVAKVARIEPRSLQQRFTRFRLHD